MKDTELQSCSSKLLLGRFWCFLLVKQVLQRLQHLVLIMLLLGTQNVVITSMKQIKRLTKAHAIFKHKMTPILCCGESLETYEAGKTAEWIEGQITADLKGLSAEQVSSMVIAYEPIWAIGTGKVS